MKHTFFLTSQKQLFFGFFCICLCRCFAQLQSETSRNFLVTRFIGRMLYVFLFTFFFSLPLIFTPVVASIFPFSHHRYKFFMFFFQRNWSPLVFISRSSSFPVIHVNVDIEIKSKERIGFCCCCFYL